MKLGAVAVPFPTVSTAEDIRKKERFIRCKAVCVDKRVFRKFKPSFVEEVALVFDDVLIEQGETAWNSIPNQINLDQDAALMLTSGTTALPRAVRVTHGNIQANTRSIIQYLDLSNQDRILVILPFYYCFGTSLLHTHLRVGGSVALCNTFAYPETALDMLEAAECTGIAGVPSTYQTLLRNTTFPKRPLTHLRKIQQAGGKLQTVFIKELCASAPHARVFVMYGQTEATARLSYLPPELLDTKLGSIGKGIPGVSLQVLNETGEKVIPGEVGEIVATGENISPGYYLDPVASEEKFIDGTLRTGDLATVDEEGFIFVVDRKADFIKSMGHRVSSQEIEAHVLEISEIVTAAAIGTPDEVQGEAIVVFVTLRKGSNITSSDILSHCQHKMARHMLPKKILIIDALPINANGKIVKTELREMLERLSE
jgi:acyl-CoA synthetase (AMP-forming)/AMP-acid ligase II